MTPAVKSLTRDCTMSEAEKLFDQHDYNAFPVVEDGKLLGVVTKFDFLPLSVLQIFRSVVDDPVPRCAHPPPASSSIARAPSSPRICEQQFRSEERRVGKE